MTLENGGIRRRAFTSSSNPITSPVSQTTKHSQNTTLKENPSRLYARSGPPVSHHSRRGFSTSRRKTRSARRTDPQTRTWAERFTLNIPEGNREGNAGISSNLRTPCLEL